MARVARCRAGHAASRPSSRPSRCATARMIATSASVGALHGSNRQPAFVLLDDGSEARIVFEQALAAEAQEIIAEVGILEAQFQQLVIGDGEDLAVLDALHGLGAAVVRRQKSKLSDHAPGPELDSNLGHAELAGDDV